MDAKIKEVNKKLLRTFQRLSYKVNYDEDAQEIAKLNFLVGHVYRLFVQKQLQTTSTFSENLQINSKKDIQSSKLITQQYEHTINQCCDKVTDLADLFLMLIKVMNKGNEKGFRNCVVSIQTVIKQLQQTLLQYQPKERNTKAKMQELKKICLRTNINIVQIPIDLIRTSSTNTDSSYNEVKNKFLPLSQINSETDIIQDLKDQVQSLNQALVENNQEFEFKLQAYTGKLAYLQNTMNKMQSEIYHLQKNQRNYLNEINQLNDQKIQDDLLIKNMARKLRKIQESSSLYQSSNFPNFSSKNSGRLQNYMCPTLSREKRMGISKSRPISRDPEENKLRIPSVRKKMRLQTLY